MNIHHDYEKMKMVAIEQAKMYRQEYNLILHNPNGDGEFDLSVGSTYEVVADSYFEKERPNVKKLFRTETIMEREEAEVNALISGVLEGAAERAAMDKEFEKVEANMRNLESAKVKRKLKKGLTIRSAHADGITYKQGVNGLERLPNTNRNSQCACGSGKKFKKCCGK